LSQPGGDEDRAEQIPQAEDQRIPAEGAVVEFAEAADAVEEGADSLQQQVRPFAGAITVEYKNGKRETDQTREQGQNGIHGFSKKR
jgi:hypothetical protein